MKFINFKTILSTVSTSLLTGCAKTGNETYDNNQKCDYWNNYWAIAGIVLGNNIGGGSKSKNKVIWSSCRCSNWWEQLDL